VIWTILKADLLWVLMMLPVQLALTLGPTLWRRRRSGPVVDRRPAWARTAQTPDSNPGPPPRCKHLGDALTAWHGYIQGGLVT
jgi:hypothetical protein